MTGADFIVSLSQVSGKTITLNWATNDGSASAGSDFTAVPATPLTFAPGDVSKTVQVGVVGDTAYEPDETFDANLSGLANITAGDVSGLATIEKRRRRAANSPRGTTRAPWRLPRCPPGRACRCGPRC